MRLPGLVFEPMPDPRFHTDQVDCLSPHICGTKNATTETLVPCAIQRDPIQPGSHYGCIRPGPSSNQGSEKMSVLKKATAVAAGTLFLLGAVAGPSQAKDNTTINDGLVNVTVGDVTVTDTIDVAAAIAANVCGVNVSNVAILGTAVDASGKKETVCRNEDGKVTITNNK